MKYILKIKQSRWVDINKKKMIHTTEDDKLFLGPPIDTDGKSTVIVEASNKPLADGYYHIINVIKK